jgi:hypothetical protein
VEAAIVFPVFFFIIVACFEFGLAFRSYMTVGDATQSAARTASTMGDQSSTDYEILRRVHAALDETPDSDVLAIVVFNAPGRNATVGSGSLTACETGSVAGVRNFYVAADLNRPSTDFGCNPGGIDDYWCPHDRKTDQSDPPDLVGVWIKIRQHSATQVLGDRIITQQSILRIEPDRA